MPKGFFTQSACVLLSEAATLDELVPLLSEFDILRRIEQPENPEFGGPTLLVSYRTAVNGLIKIDLRNRAWPDHMGDPKSEVSLFGAWSMGYYGPFSFPGGLSRSRQQSWVWPAGKDAVERHTAMIHISLSYVLGGDENAPVLPPNYDPLDELHHITRIAMALLEHRNALAYFNPNGEILADAETIRKSLAANAEQRTAPLDIWTNIRVLNPNNGWMIMDTVGMQQLDRPDLEACFPANSYALGDVANFLRNCCGYLVSNGEVIRQGDTMNGPDAKNWQAVHPDKELFTPPRRLIRWFPLDGSSAPPEFRATPPNVSIGKRIGRLFGIGKNRND